MSTLISNQRALKVHPTRKVAAMNWEKTCFFHRMIYILGLGQGVWLSALAPPSEPIL